MLSMLSGFSAAWNLVTLPAISLCFPFFAIISLHFNLCMLFKRNHYDCVCNGRPIERTMRFDICVCVEKIQAAFQTNKQQNKITKKEKKKNGKSTSWESHRKAFRFDAGFQCGNPFSLKTHILLMVLVLLLQFDSIATCEYETCEWRKLTNEQKQKENENTLTNTPIHADTHTIRPAVLWTRMLQHSELRKFVPII